MYIVFISERREKVRGESLVIRINIIKIKKINLEIYIGPIWRNGEPLTSQGSPVRFRPIPTQMPREARLITPGLMSWLWIS